MSRSIIILISSSFPNPGFGRFLIICSLPLHSQQIRDWVAKPQASNYIWNSLGNHTLSLSEQGFSLRVTLIQTRYPQEFHVSFLSISSENSSSLTLLLSSSFSKIPQQKKSSRLSESKLITVRTMKYFSFHEAKSNNSISSSKMQRLAATSCIMPYAHILLYPSMNMCIYI